MAETHDEAGCQCGTVSFAVDLDIGNAITRNCSRCKPTAFVLAVAPRDKFELRSGADNLTEWRFNTRKIRHLFCTTCGVESFAYGATRNGGEVAAVNINCLEGVDARQLEPRAVDGRSM